VCLLHLFELSAALDSRILVFTFAFPGDTFRLFNVVVDVALNAVTHLLNLAKRLLFLQLT
jgi:hypothetical protein